MNHFPGLALMLLTALGLLVAVPLFVWALRTGRRGILRGLLTFSAVWSGVYLAFLLGSSLTSAETVLGRDEEMRFCGFYLDCHLAVAVADVATAKTLGEGPNRVGADGLFYIVTVRVSSNAVAATFQLRNPGIFVVDGEGNRYARAIAAESIWQRAAERAGPIVRPVQPGASYTFDVVFDLPEEVSHPRLRVSHGDAFERLTELFLIGDEDSLLHARTTFRLSPAR